VVFDSYSLFSKFCSDERLEIVATEDSSEKILSSIFHNLWSGGNLSGECWKKLNALIIGKHIIIETLKTIEKWSN